MCLELYVNDQIIKTATLIYLILICHSERENKMAHQDAMFHIQFSEHNDYCCVGVGEKLLNIRRRK
jgi:hypothetical protein